MAREIIVALAGLRSSFSFVKVERAKLYPTRKRVSLDAVGLPCTRASLTEDGSTVLQSGMSAQGYFTQAGRWVPKEELVGIDPEGRLLELKPSTLGVEQPLEGPLPATMLLDHAVVSVYALDALVAEASLLASLNKGDLYRFPFNYGSDYHNETAFLMANDEGIFAMICHPTPPSWVEESSVFIAEAEVEDASDELDFEMI